VALNSSRASAAANAAPSSPNAAGEFTSAPVTPRASLSTAAAVGQSKAGSATEINEPSAPTSSADSTAANPTAAAPDAQAAAAELRWIRSFLQQPQWRAEAEAQPTAALMASTVATDPFAAVATEVESPAAIAAAAVPISSSSSGSSSDGASPSSASPGSGEYSCPPGSDRECDWQLLTEAALQMEGGDSAAAAPDGSAEQP